MPLSTYLIFTLRQNTGKMNHHDHYPPWGLYSIKIIGWCGRPSVSVTMFLNIEYKPFLLNYDFVISALSSPLMESPKPVWSRMGNPLHSLCEKQHSLMVSAFLGIYYLAAKMPCLPWSPERAWIPPVFGELGGNLVHSIICCGRRVLYVLASSSADSERSAVSFLFTSLPNPLNFM